MTLRYDINLSILFTELPLLERPAAAAAAGFTAAEFWWPFGTEAQPAGSAVDEFIAALDAAGVRLVGLNLLDDLSVGSRGLVSVPEHAGRFRDAIPVAVEIGRRTGCRNFNALYGNRIEGVDPEFQDQLAVANLDAATKAAAIIGGTVLIEALNAIESPLYPVTSTRAALDVIGRTEEVTGATNLALLLDLYHMARMGEDLETVIGKHAGRVGHVQIADVPDRGAPGTGGLDYRALFAALEAADYRVEEGLGSIGLEYKATNGVSADSFAWLPAEERGWRS
ncbi:hydroxypyruvate isomerase family protein [Actinospica sp.]|jgi:hydroxypyruvate isomerase|uniref:hydroxypyruvate isomerase family protein n=1 Tax=Actinospica sp. TaxID=1872142 RepID=UPI002D1E255D|nr:TIM barrel protein [Actinospica sp.]HWG24394.1 TIM barrel protein [Actinospica sp.]